MVIILAKIGQRQEESQLASAKSSY